MPDIRGFIIHPFFRTIKGRTQICLLGRAEDGKTFAVMDDGFRPAWAVRSSDATVCRSLLARHVPADRFAMYETDFTTMDGAPCTAVEWAAERDSSRGASVLADGNIRTYESDVKPYDKFLSDRHIHGSVLIKGEWVPGRHVDMVFINPQLEPAKWHPRLSVLSLDIETDPFGSEIQAVGCVQRNPWGGGEMRAIFFVSEELDDPGIRCFQDEASMLKACIAFIREMDPDIITGWNIIEFDFARIAERCDHHGIAMDFSRSDEAARFLPGEGRTSSAVIISGRQVLDGIRLVRAGPERFEDYSLETVAQGVLGVGKEIDEVEGKAKLEELKRLHDTEPAAFCSYCVNDAALVLDILDRTGLLELTLMRCLLIGVPLGRAWTSIAAFEHIYMEALHDRKIVAPARGIDPLPGGRAPGGAIITPRTGLFDNVLVFDFKSLYPSIIRTFNIDPAGYLGGGEYQDPDEDEPTTAPGSAEYVTAPNGARFSRSAAILPDLLEVFFKERSAAKERGDSIASYVYKIVMNSFYGVLGARGCRFAGTPLAGAITSFGQKLLYWCRDALSGEGYRVLYGDTDSLFVEAGMDAGSAYGRLAELGNGLCDMINRRLAEWLEDLYQVESKLELEFEKIYIRFFIPPMRMDIASPDLAAMYTSAAGDSGLHESTAENNIPAGGETAMRGRSKGYAGLAVSGDGDPGTVEIKGMEAVRSDWTMAAREFQTELIERVFHYQDIGSIEKFITGTIQALTAGEMDRKLVYRKILRKSVSGYTKSMPPHVKAASLLPPEEQRGTVRYLITRDGPQPVGYVTSPPDYDHYVSKQLRPIAEAFMDIIPLDIARLFSADSQLSLF